LKINQLAASLCALAIFAAGALAQNAPGNIAYLEFQTPKNGMVKQYEDGRKAKAAWHKQQNDTQALYVSEIITGERTGDYVVGAFGLRWADLDKPAVPAEADMAEYNKDVAPYVEKMTARYFEFLPKWSNPSPDMKAKYIEVITFHVKYGKGDDFRSAVAKVHEAHQKVSPSLHYVWYRLENGGLGGTYVLTIDHANWASFEDDPNVKPTRDALREAFGEQEAMSVIERLNFSIETTYSEIVETRPDLSYIPSK
jgi:quinol monooxygenase YgiN